MDFSPNSIFFPSLLRLAAQSRSEIEFLRSSLISSVSCVFPSLNTCCQNLRVKLKNIQNVKTVLSNCKYLIKPRFFCVFPSMDQRINVLFSSIFFICFQHSIDIIEFFSKCKYFASYCLLPVYPIFKNIMNIS